MAGVIYRKEREILEYLVQFQNQYGYSPTLLEIANATGHKSISTIHSLIKSLVEKGYVQKVEGNTRVLKVTDEKVINRMAGNDPTLSLPLMGYIAAGKPLEPHTDPNATFKVSASMISGRRTSFVLQVRGNSMIEDGILDGDYVVVEKTEQAVDGDIVVALVDNSLATLKRFYRENGRITLKPANSQMDPIYPNSLTIQGKGNRSGFAKGIYSSSVSEKFSTFVVLGFQPRTIKVLETPERLREKQLELLEDSDIIV